MPPGNNSEAFFISYHLISKKFYSPVTFRILHRLLSEMSQLFEQHILPAAQKMYRYAWSILRDEDNAHDVVQECLTKIWNKRNTLPTVNDHEAWAMRIVRNQCYDWVKSNTRMVINNQEDVRVEDRTADHDLIYQDQEAWLTETLETLPSTQREIFHLREIEACSYQEIAETLSISVNEVKVYLHRARGKVRSKMQQIESYGIAN